MTLVVLAALGIGGWYAIARAKPSAEANQARAQHENPTAAISVEVIQPKPGGIVRMCVQPGTVEPFEAADMYAKASGFLIEQNVDIGSRVKLDDVLARISVPEYEKQVQRDEARVLDATAKVRQMEANLKVAKADAKAADASVTLAKVLVRAKVAFRQYREKQLIRTKELAKEQAINARVVDEQEDFYMSALEAENSANEGVTAAQERAIAARAKIEQAEADIDAAKAGVEVAAAELEKSRVLLDYTVIKSPFNGVVTKRNFHPGERGRRGDYIKSADQGGTIPVLAVERTDKMRVVIQVPDRDVPYVSLGDPAVIEIDALPGVVFETKGADTVGISRWADAEDAATRTMRTEVDLKNPDGVLRHGMYGRATLTLTLSPGTPNALRIPSSALFGKAEGGRGAVRVVREGKVRILPIRYATDNGVEAEILLGLNPTDRVIVRSSASIEEGTPVAVAEPAAAGH